VCVCGGGGKGWEHSALWCSWWVQVVWHGVVGWGLLPGLQHTATLGQRSTHCISHLWGLAQGPIYDKIQGEANEGR
jgi:hypothetical protein